MFARIKKAVQEAQAARGVDADTTRRARESLARKADGDAFLAAGNLVEATRCFRASVALDATHVAVYAPLAYALREQGQLEEAIRRLETAISIDGRIVDVHWLLALSLRDLGRLDEAIRQFEAVLGIDPGLAECYVALCQASAQQGRMEAARAVVERGLAHCPESAELHGLSGNLFLHAGHFERAVGSLGQALRLDPRYLEAHYNRGIALQNLERFEEALASFDIALSLRPAYPAAQLGRAKMLLRLARLDEALASFQQALQSDPDNPDLLNNCGLLQRQLGRLGDALITFERALKVRPDFAEAFSNRGLVLHELDRFDEALADYDRALQIKPELTDAHVNRGNALRELLRHEDALAAYQRALDIKPDLEAIYLNESLSRLVLGDLARGWPRYEWRWQTDQSVAPVSQFTQPIWLGKESLEGKTVLLHAEQGMGDTIQFCRYAKLVADGGAKVLLAVQAPLKPLLEDLEGVDRIIVPGEPPPPFDYHCPLLSLPLAFGTTLETIPRDRGYLRVGGPRFDARLAAWRARLGAQDRPRIGLVWSGNANHKNDRNRSIALSGFARILSDRARFVCLQNEIRAADATWLERRPVIERFDKELIDFAETAALIANLDLVISVDTSVAHLAAAMGKPVWLLLPFNPDWRWLLEREDSPWYESVRLFRQTRSGHWDDTLSRVGQEIERFVEGARTPS